MQLVCPDYPPGPAFSSAAADTLWVACTAQVPCLCIVMRCFAPLILRQTSCPVLQSDVQKSGVAPTDDSFTLITSGMSPPHGFAMSAMRSKRAKDFRKGVPLLLSGLRTNPADEHEKRVLIGNIWCLRLPSCLCVRMAVLPYSIAVQFATVLKRVAIRKYCNQMYVGGSDTVIYTLLFLKTPPSRALMRSSMGDDTGQ